MLNARAIIINPNILGGLAFFKEQYIRFHTTGIEDTGRQTKNGMKIEITEKLLTNFGGSSAIC